MDSPQSSEIMFFLGAGASVPAGLKDVVNVIPDLLAWLESEQAPYPGCKDCIKEIISIMNDWYNTNQPGKSVDIETLLEMIERLESSFNDIIPAFFENKNLKLGESCVEILRKRTLSRLIKMFIQNKFQEFDTFEYYQPLDDFLLRYNPLLIFTTNYDLIIEQYTYHHRPKIEYTDFFIGTAWSPEKVNFRDFAVILHKIHGSVSWARTEEGQYVKLTQKTRDNKLQLMTGEYAVPLILYPGKKLEYIEPTLELLERLKKSLSEVKCCFAVGYKFGDDHIAKLIRYSALRNESLVVFLNTHSAHTIYYNKLKRHRDDEFPHGFTHEGFKRHGFDTTIPTALEGRTICLPYKFQNIFPYLSDYYENLKKGLRIEKSISLAKHRLEPLTLYDESTLVDCLKCYLSCEYFERIDVLVNKKSGAWDYILREIAKVEFQRYNLEIIYNIFLKSYFNLFSSDRSKVAKDLLVKYLTVFPGNIKMNVKDYMVNLTYSISEIAIDGAFWFNIFKYLEEQFVSYKKITEVGHQDILELIQKARDFFDPWKQGQIALDKYLDRIIDNTTEEFQFITSLIAYQQELVHTSEEAILVNAEISSIITAIETNRLLNN